MISLKNKVVIVTGGASGIGRAISTLFAQLSAKVVIADINAREGEKLSNEINALFEHTDITHLKSVREMTKKVKEKLGKIDVLINSAGWDEIKPFLETTPEFWEKVISINFKGVINTTYCVLPYMIEAKNGVIINISSDAGRVGSSGEAVYSGCKAGIIGFSKAIAREYAKEGIRVNVVCPGPTRTPLLESITKDQLGAKIISAMEKYIPLGRLGSPEDIAPAVAFLASDYASYITGQVISISGGLTMVG